MLDIETRAGPDYPGEAPSPLAAAFDYPNANGDLSGASLSERLAHLHEAIARPARPHGISSPPMGPVATMTLDETSVIASPLAAKSLGAPVMAAWISRRRRRRGYDVLRQGAAWVVTVLVASGTVALAVLALANFGGP